MFKRNFLNQNGFTLIELLGALALFGLISSLAFTIFINVQGYSDRSQDRLTLRQEANAFITMLRTTHTNTNDNYEIKIGADNEVLIGDKNFRLTDSFHFSLLEITYQGSTISTGGEQITVNGGTKAPFQVALTVKDAHDQSYQLDTTINNSDINHQIAYQSSNGGDDFFDEKEDFDVIQIENPNDYLEVTDQSSTCQYYQDVKITGSTVGNWNTCTNSDLDPAVFTGSAWFPYGINTHNGIEYTIEKNFFNDGNTITDGNSIINILGNAKLNGSTSFRSTSQFSAKNIHASQNILIQENAKIQTTGGMRVDGILQGYRNATIDIGGYLFSKSLFLQENAKLVVDKNITIEATTTVNGSAQLIINGNATFNGNFHFQQGTNVKVYGDAIFNGTVTPQYSPGKLCVEGKVTFTQGKPSWLTVQTSCGP